MLSMQERDWKRDLIELTQLPAARERKIDATFFPRVELDALERWQTQVSCNLPDEWRSFYLQSNGMEAQKGGLNPLLPLEDCSLLENACGFEHPWLEFGSSLEHRFFVRLSDSPAVFRVEKLGSDEEFFARNLWEYFEKLFRGDADRR